jgi:hypothetical protein
LKKSALGAGAAFNNINCGTYAQAISNIQLLDMKVAGGASFTGLVTDITWIGDNANGKDVEILWFLTVNVTHLGSPLANAAVVVKDVSNNTVFSGTTTASGTIANIQVQAKKFTQTTPDHTAINTILSTPLSVVVTPSGGSATTQNTNFTGNTTLNFVV